MAVGAEVAPGEDIVELCGNFARARQMCSEVGLFVEIAGECRHAYGDQTALLFICGRDAAERILNWDYGRPDAFEQMLEDFEMLVAPRSGDFQTPDKMQRRIRPLPVDGELSPISSTEVRERVSRGLPWEHMVPAEIIAMVRKIYGTR